MKKTHDIAKVKRPLSDIARATIQQQQIAREAEVLAYSDSFVQPIVSQDNSSYTWQSVGDPQSYQKTTRTYNVMGSTISIPEVVSQYTLVDTQNMNVVNKNATVSTIDSVDAVLILESASNAIAMAAYFIQQVLSLRMLLPAFEDIQYSVKGYDGTSLVGGEFAKAYHGLTTSSNPEEKLKASVISDVKRYVQGSLVQGLTAQSGFYSQLAEYLKTKDTKALFNIESTAGIGTDAFTVSTNETTVPYNVGASFVQTPIFKEASPMLETALGNGVQNIGVQGGGNIKPQTGPLGVKK